MHAACKYHIHAYFLWQVIIDKNLKTIYLPTNDFHQFCKIQSHFLDDNGVRLNKLSDQTQNTFKKLLYRIFKINI